MNNEPIDWEATMMHTLSAAKAASLGSVRVVAAIAEMVEQQRDNAILLNKTLENTSRLLLAQDASRAAQEAATRQLVQIVGRRQSPPRLPTVWAVFVALGGFGVGACAALLLI